MQIYCIAIHTMDLWKEHDLTTKHLTLKGHECEGRVVDIIDGDTIQIVINVFGGFYKFNVRLAGIDTCEMKSTNIVLKRKAEEAKMQLFTMITGIDNMQLVSRKDIQKYLQDHICLVWLNCSDFDKYGRLLAEIYSDKSMVCCFSTVLVEKNLAYHYTGDTKASEDQQIKLLEHT